MVDNTVIEQSLDFMCEVGNDQFLKPCYGKVLFQPSVLHSRLYKVKRERLNRTISCEDEPIRSYGIIQAVK